MKKDNVLLRSRKKQALALIQQNKFVAARVLYEQICAHDRSDCEAWVMLGVLEGRLGNAQKAADCCSRAVALAPRHVGAQFNLGVALCDLGRVDDAIEALRRVLSLAPGHRDATRTLTHLLCGIGRFADAVQVVRDALPFNPADAEMHATLGGLLQGRGLLEEAETWLRRSIDIDPALEMAYDNLGTVLCAQGRITESIACYRQGLTLNSRNAVIRSNMLLALHYGSDVAGERLLDEHRQWAEIHEHRDAQRAGYSRDRDPDRRLRVGYISPDLREHSVAHFIEPLLSAHDRTEVEVFCYADVRAPDQTTHRLKELADVWYFTSDLRVAEFVSRVLEDRIDILVDLAGHTAGNRLEVFAHGPAPVQVTYLGYPGTTGLTSMNYRLTDSLTDPAGDEQFYSEELVKLPGCFLCYQPPYDAPEVVQTPAIECGHVTFGSFNNLAKITPEVVRSWARLLNLVPNSRILIKNPSLTDTSTRTRYYSLFQTSGVDPARVDLMGHTPGRREHLALYGRIDIALDTFPYNGTTTTCEALWMGVPVVTLTGTRHAARVGATLLNGIQLNELIAHGVDEYVTIAAYLAAAVPRLAALRVELRGRLARSPLCDRASFARKVEQAYRWMWQRWCGLSG